MAASIIELPWTGALTAGKPSAYVFGNELGERLTDLREAWKLTCAAAKITGLRFHDLRREFGSRLMETPRISPHVVRDWLGHADIATTSRYLATTERTLKDALQQFEQHREEVAKRCTSVAHVAQTPAEDTPAEGLQNRANSLDSVN